MQPVPDPAHHPTRRPARRPAPARPAAPPGPSEARGPCDAYRPGGAAGQCRSSCWASGGWCAGSQACTEMVPPRAPSASRPEVAGREGRRQRLSAANADMRRAARRQCSSPEHGQRDGIPFMHVLQPVVEEAAPSESFGRVLAANLRRRPRGAGLYIFAFGQRRLARTAVAIRKCR